MGTHCMIFMTIDNLVSLTSSLFSRQVQGRTWARPSDRKSKDLSVLGRWGKPVHQAVGFLASPVPLARQDVSNISYIDDDPLGRPSFSPVLLQVRRSALFRL
jgi:hypothetical protein